MTTVMTIADPAQAVTRCRDEMTQEAARAKALWQRRCFRCHLPLTKFDPLQVVVCTRCGWTWG